MKKKFTDYVYLSELDSVKTSYNEQLEAEIALFNAIVYQGKAVVLTYNQIIDSIAFLHCIKDPISFQILLDFFKDGKLLVNQYKANMNISKYFQDNIHKKTSFHSTYFSFLKKYPYDLKVKVYDGLNQSIQYGDKLFLENNIPPDIIDEDKKSLLDYIEFILTINAYMNTYKCYVVPKDESELTNHKMKDYLLRIIEYLNVHHIQYAKQLAGILEVHCQEAKCDSRSDYKDVIEKTICDMDRHVIMEFVNLAYNCALEYSIPIVHPTDHLQEDIMKILSKEGIDQCDDLALVYCMWEDGYRVSSITSSVYQKIKRIKWKIALIICPFVEVTRLGTSFIIAFAVMLIMNLFSFVQNMWQSYSMAIFITFLYNVFLDEIQEILMNKLPDWFYDSGFLKQFKYCYKDIYVLLKRRK